MLVLEATSERQGERDDDYHSCTDGELAYHPGTECANRSVAAAAAGPVSQCTFQFDCEVVAPADGPVIEVDVTRAVVVAEGGQQSLHGQRRRCVGS